MGLDTTHDAWSGSYSRFHAFRTALAAAIGLDLHSMKGFGGTTPWPDKSAEPLVALLNHSDCDGAIEVEDLAPLAARLEEIARLVEPWDACARKFAAGCREALAAGERIGFW